MIRSRLLSKIAAKAAQRQMPALARGPRAQAYPIDPPSYILWNGHGSPGVNESQGVRRLAVQRVIALKTQISFGI